MQYDDVQKRVLKKLYFERMIGGKHTSVEAIKRGFPSHEKGHVDKAIKKLVKANLLEHHPTSYGHQYSLNPRRIQEIEDLIE